MITIDKTHVYKIARFGHRVCAQKCSCNCLRVAFLFVGLAFVSPTLKAAPPAVLKEKPIEQTIPHDLDTMVDRIVWATEKVQSRLGAGQSVSDKDQFTILITLKIATREEAKQWHSDPLFLEQLEKLMVSTLQADVGNWQSMVYMFRALKFLPVTENTKYIALASLQKSADAKAVWLCNLQDHFTQSDIDEIRSKILNVDVVSIQSWELALIAAAGGAENQEALSLLADRARLMELSSNTQSHLPYSVSNINSLLDLDSARKTSESMIEWGLKQSHGLNVVPRSYWALNEVYSREGASTKIWTNFWEQLEITTYKYIADSGLISSNNEDRYVAYALSPWIAWANSNDIDVPARITTMSPTKRRLFED